MNIIQNYEKIGLNMGVFCMIFSQLAHLSTHLRGASSVAIGQSRALETIIAVKNLRLTFFK